jgi:hypothetical protein
MVDGMLGGAFSFANTFSDLSPNKGRPLDWLLPPVAPLMVGKVQCLATGDPSIVSMTAASSRSRNSSIEPLMVRWIRRIGPTTLGLTVAGPSREGATVDVSIGCKLDVDIPVL